MTDIDNIDNLNKSFERYEKLVEEENGPGFYRAVKMDGMTQKPVKLFCGFPLSTAITIAKDKEEYHKNFFVAIYDPKNKTVGYHKVGINEFALRDHDGIIGGCLYDIDRLTTDKTVIQPEEFYEAICIPKSSGGSRAEVKKMIERALSSSEEDIEDILGPDFDAKRWIEQHKPQMSATTA